MREKVRASVPLSPIPQGGSPARLATMPAFCMDAIGAPAVKVLPRPDGNTEYASSFGYFQPAGGSSLIYTKPIPRIAVLVRRIGEP